MNKISYLLLFMSAVLLLLSGCSVQEKSDFIAVNLVGYPVNETKTAFLVNGSAEWFELVEAANESVVYSGTIEPGGSADSATGDRVLQLDFSDFDVPGAYYLRTGPTALYESEVFKIGKDIYSNAALAAFQSFYYHRCGTAVDNGTGWKYKLCHPHDASFYGAGASHKIVSGGWHDAGDYNKFSVNTSLSASLLLYAYEKQPQAFLDGQLNIPEQKNGVPDLLDEVKWGLDWLLKMQADQGGIYHKVSQKIWIGEFLPHTDPAQRYLFRVSSAATASFSATAALASRLYKTVNPEYADQLGRAALNAWEFLLAHPDNIPKGGFKNPADVRGGEYGDVEDMDERLWAALELYRLTSDKSYLHFFIEHYRPASFENIPPLSWRDVKSIVLNTFVQLGTSGEYYQQKAGAKKLFLAQADRIMATKAINSYKNLISPEEYYWGSNSVGLAYAYHLLQAYEISGDPKYREGAYDQLHFILGRNPHNLSQVTGVGSRPVMHPYHQLSELDDVKEPVPGMLVGGPNNHLLLNGKMLSPFPAYNYEDTFRNYLVNEVAINYTAIFAYVSSYFSAYSTLNTLTQNQNDFP